MTAPALAYHATDCDATACAGCGFIAADGFWYPGPCPDSERDAQLARAEGNT